MNRSELTSRAILQILHPWALFISLLLYSIGVGVAVFLGRPVSWSVYLLGQACVLLLMIFALFLNAFFNSPLEEQRQRKLRRVDAGEPLEDADLNWVIPRNSLLFISIVAMTVGAVITVLLYANKLLDLTAFIFLGIGFVIAFLYSVPPFHLANTGYGELISAIFLVYLTPAFAYALQTGEVHRLIAMITFPLTAMFLAMMLALSLQPYYQDLKSNHKTLMVQVGWQRGMILHNLMILMAYFLIGLALILRMPWSLAWPMLLTFPVGLYQFYQMWQISNGAPPRWRILQLTAAASFGLMAYFVAFALWIG